MELVIVPFHDYKKWINEGFRTRDAHLYQHFEKDSRVSKILIVNRPVSLAELIIKRKSWKTPVGEIYNQDLGYRLTKISAKTFVVDFYLNDFIKVLYQRKKWWTTAFKNKKVIESINKAIKFLDMQNPILFLQNPMSISLEQNISFDKFAFDAIDNWLHHPQMKHQIKEVEYSYDYVTNNADCIFTVSESLQKLFSENEKTFWVPNGVDLDFFKNAIKNEFDINDVRLGYVGKIQDRVDLDLIEKMVVEFPKFKFDIMGPIYSNKKRIRIMEKKYDNLNFLGDIHYDELPEALKKIDITLVPHKVSEFTNSMNPLKVYEYIASGKPVITTDVAGVNNLSEFVFVSNTDDDFIQNINIVVKKMEIGKINSNKVLDSVKNNISWENKACKIIDEFKGGF